MLKNKKNTFIDERCNEILELSKKIDYDDLKYLNKDKKIRENSFNGFDNTFSFFKNMKDGNIMLEKTSKKIKMSTNQI